MTTVEELFGARTATVVENAISPQDARDLRAHAARHGYQRYGIVDVGALLAPDRGPWPPRVAMRTPWAGT